MQQQIPTGWQTKKATATATANATADLYGMTSQKGKGKGRDLSTALRFGRDDEVVG
ncbi:MAG: hypothetical protein WBY53_02495 [Acidobacteriaceae bacterium]